MSAATALTRILPLLFTLAVPGVLTKANNTHGAKCISGYELEYQQNMQQDLNFCSDHASRTCCSANDMVTYVKAKIGYAKMKTDLSDQCFLLTSKALCSRCDGDVVSHSLSILPFMYRVQD